MNLLMVGCNHRAAGVDIRQQLAFGAQQTSDALQRWRARFADTELALLSTCNRVELYAVGAAPDAAPQPDELVDAMLSYHGLPARRMEGRLVSLAQRDAVLHLFRVAASLDSMVVGEPQILSQVKEAYQRAVESGSAGPGLHELFQAAMRAARRVHNETRLHRHRVSIPSVAIADFATRVFERFDDKRVLLIGAGEMAEETLRYLKDAGARRIRVVNRSWDRAAALAEAWGGAAAPWEELWEELAAADLVIGAASVQQPLVTAAEFQQVVARKRQQRPLFVLDLAAPRNFDADVGEQLGVYLYSLDDLAHACERNRAARAAELPSAEKIVLAETDAFMAAAHHRLAGPVITGLRRNLEEPKRAELERLFRRLPQLDQRARGEIELFADRLVNKLLHPPMESLRDASQEGPPHGLLDALRRLFRLED
ncbi:MAG: glutamyl-tRNA reductase [Planctomycetota bacterium]|nr:MAG: glutamyl-tRNA reductase [Planctomycetota bacterium]